MGCQIHGLILIKVGQDPGSPGAPAKSTTWGATWHHHLATFGTAQDPQNKVCQPGRLATLTRQAGPMATAEPLSTNEAWQLHSQGLKLSKLNFCPRLRQTNKKLAPHAPCAQGFACAVIVLSTRAAPFPLLNNSVNAAARFLLQTCFMQSWLLLGKKLKTKLSPGLALPRPPSPDPPAPHNGRPHSTRPP